MRTPFSVAFLALVGASGATASGPRKLQTQPIVDDAPQILAGIVAAGSGNTYQLPNRTLYIPNGLNLGSSCNNVTIKGQANTVLVGGQLVSGWQPLQPSDPHYSQIPASAQGHVLVASAPFLTSLNAGPSVELYMGSAVQSQTVWPLPNAGTRGDGWMDISTAAKFAGIGQPQAFQHVSDPVPPTWDPSRAASVWVEGWANEGRCFYGHLGPVDATNTTVTGYAGAYTGVAGFGGINIRFRYRNVLEELQLPGQYFVDTVGQEVYWYPPASYNSQPTFLSAGSGGIKISGASGITLAGAASTTPLPIVGNEGDSIDILGSTGLLFQYLQVFGCGAYGMNTKDFNSSQIKIDTCDFIGCGLGALHLCGGDRLNRVPSGISVIQPYISAWARLVGDHPAIELSGMSPSVTNPYITNGPAAAVLFGTYAVGVPAGQQDGSNDAVLSGALIDGALSQMSDYGSVYIGRNWAALGNQIVNTTIQNVHPYQGQGQANAHIGWAIYLDDSQAGTSILHCTIKNSDCGITLGGGWGNTINDIHFDNIPRFSIAVDSRIAPGHWGQKIAQSDGAAYKTITQWFPWGMEPAAWSAAYDNLDGNGHGLGSWMSLYVNGKQDPSYALPLYDTITNITYGSSMHRPGFEDADTYKNADAGWNYGGQQLVPTNVAQGDNGGAPPFAGRTTPLSPGF